MLATGNCYHSLGRATEPLLEQFCDRRARFSTNGTVVARGLWREGERRGKGKANCCLGRNSFLGFSFPENKSPQGKYK